MAKLDSSYFQASGCSYDLLHYKSECAHLITAIKEQKERTVLLIKYAILYALSGRW